MICLLGPQTPIVGRLHPEDGADHAFSTSPRDIFSGRFLSRPAPHGGGSVLSSVDQSSPPGRAERWETGGSDGSRHERLALCQASNSSGSWRSRETASMTHSPRKPKTANASRVTEFQSTRRVSLPARSDHRDPLVPPAAQTETTAPSPFLEVRVVAS